MPGRFVVARLRSEWICNGGVVLAILPLLQEPAPRYIEKIEWPWVTRRFTGAVSATWANAALLTAGRCIELEFVDAAGATVTVEVRIVEPVDGWPSPVIAITALGPEADLRERNTIMTATENGVFTLAPVETGTPSAILTRLLAACPSYVALGTVTSTGLIGLNYANASMPYDCAKLVAESVFQQLGSKCELQLRRNGATNWLLDLVVVGASATVPDVRSGRGLFDFQRRTSRLTQVTRAIVLDSAGRPGMGDNRWEISTVSAGAYIEVIDTAGGLGPAQEADLFNGNYVVGVDDATHQITDTIVTSSTITRLTMASTAGLVVGDLVAIVRNAAKDALFELNHLGYQATYGVLTRKFGAGLLDGLTNAVRNPDLSDWSGAMPTGWQKIGSGTITKETSIVLIGNSAKIVDAAGATKIRRTANSNCWLGPLPPAAPTLPVHFSVWYYPAGTGWTGGVTVQFFLNGTLMASHTNVPTVFDTWHRIDAAVLWNASNMAVDILVSAFQTPAGGALYVGPFQALTGTSIPITGGGGTIDAYSNAVDSFRRGSNPSKLLQYASQLMVLYGAPPAAYRVTAGELTRHDPARWPHDIWTLGGIMNVKETERLALAIAPRVVSLDRNLLNPLETVVELNNRVPDFVELLGGGGSA